MRIVLVISSLFPGGAGRVIIRMANYWSAAGHFVGLLTFDDGSTHPFFTLDRRIEHQSLGFSGNSKNLIDGLRNNFDRIRVLRKAIAGFEPDVVVSFVDQTNVTTLFATRLTRIPVCVSERTDPSQHDIGKIWSWIRKGAYGWADVVVVQTRKAAGYFPQRIRKRIQVIPNSVDSPDPEIRARTVDLEKPVILGMGRLVPAKGFDLLIEAFSMLASWHPEWRLTIIGEGPDRSRLEKLVREKELTGRVSLPGAVDDPYCVLPEADLFVLPSRYEGYPNVLCEAMACELPVVSFDCPSGPADIVRDGVDGVLVPVGDVGRLAETMGRLMRDENERRRLAQMAPEVIQRFSVDTVMNRWNDLLSGIVARRGRKPDANEKT